MALSKESKLYIIIAFIVFVIIMFLCLKLENKNKVIESQNTYIEKLQKTIDYYKNFDSTYVNTRDSIEYNIIKRDSTIYKIKEEYEKQKDSVLLSNDGTVVSKFNELVWAD